MSRTWQVRPSSLARAKASAGSRVKSGTAAADAVAPMLRDLSEITSLHTAAQQRSAAFWSDA
jgi:hypothetical protein